MGGTYTIMCGLPFFCLCVLYVQLPRKCVCVCVVVCVDSVLMCVLISTNISFCDAVVVHSLFECQQICLNLW